MRLLNKELENCRRCPRLVKHREAIAKKEIMRRKAFQGYSYWGKPVPGFGDPEASILILGLAPGAHGANRVGRMFSGDASGEFLFAALHKKDLASSASSKDLDDGLFLTNLWITAAARCVPPGNKLIRQEILNCRHWLKYDFAQLKNVKVVLALGAVAHDAYLELRKFDGKSIVKKNYPFKHSKEYIFDDGIILLDSYHVSFQNTNTGRLSRKMFEEVVQKAINLSKA